MNDTERDELLIRMDERQKTMYKAIIYLKPVVEDNKSDIKSARSNITLLKWLGAIITGLLGFLK